MTQNKKNNKTANRFARALFLALMASSALTAWQANPARAQSVQASGATNTQVYKAPNGVTVVDIANPNATGMSHNKFTNYNVPTNGLVLNNGDASQFQRTSQLAGSVMANTNLHAQAGLILNEVTGMSRSELLGYTEVVGGQADVIVANPYGITCNGCGFINVPNATLTTGVPQVSGAGALTGFQIDTGDILVTGNGLDATKQDYLGLFARSIKLDGQLNAKDVDVVAGANDWDVATKTATPRAGTGAAPTVAIDSSAVGGMYANRIRLIATESGVGVKMLGEAAAGVGDFTLTSSGKIEIGSAVSAKRDVKITSTATGANAIKTVNAKISAKRDTALTASTGEVRLEGGLLTAENNLSITSASLSDVATVNAGLADNNKRYALNNLRLSQTGAASLDGTTYGAGANFGATLGSLSVGSGAATLYSTTGFTLTTTGDMLLGAAQLKNAGGVTLASTGGDITLAAGGAVQSTAGGLSVSAGDQFANAGTLSSDTQDILLRAAASINNTGSIYAKTALALADAAGGNTQSIDNSGTMIADGQFTIIGNQMTNSGTLQGKNASSATLADSFGNSGTALFSTAAGQAGTLIADTVSNLSAGVIQAAQDLTVTVGSAFTNSGKVIAGRDLKVDSNYAATVTNNAGATLQAANTLTVNKPGSPYNIAFTQAGTAIGNQLDIAVGSLNNTGTLQGGAGASTISVAGTLTNGAGGKIIGSTAGGTATIGADTITNSGIIQSAGLLGLNLGSTLNNNSGAKIIGTGGVNILGSDIAYTVNNTGTIQAGGTLAVKGQGGGNGVTVNGLGSTAVFLGNTLDVNAGTVSLANGTGMTASNGMTFSAGTLSLLGSASYIVSNAGSATLNLANAFTNSGLLYSGGNLTLNTAALTNAATGGIAASGTVDLNSTGTVTNNGAMYGGTLLDVSAANFTNSASGTMDGYDITATVTGFGTFTNNNDINASRNLTISARNIYNDIAGGDQRVWSTQQAFSSSTGGWSSDPDWLLWGESANRYTTQTWYYYQYYNGTAPTAADKPRLLANGSVNINSFAFARNLGGIISAPTVNIASSVSGAQFVNDSYDLRRDNYKRTWRDHVSCCSDVIYLNYSYGLDDSGSYVDTSSVTSFGAGIYAGTLNASGFSLTNAGSVQAASVDSTTGSGATATTGTTGTSATTGASAATFGGITITLPSNPNGFFVVSQNPNSGYLIETNPKFGANSPLGSQYMIDRLGLDPAEQQKRLGDGNYEQSLIRDQLTSQVGLTSIIPGETEAAQMQRLMDNGVDASKEMGLTYGKPLTADQAANLKTDMVWMVETEVMGQKVLAPVVYLSAATKAGIAGGAAIVGNDVSMNLASVTNTGGTIAGNNTLDITSKGDITNTSGTIKGGDVSLKSTEGSIINETSAKSGGNEFNGSTVIGKTGSIEATGNLKVDANKDITNKGANMSAGGDADLKAGGNITFDVIEDKKAETTMTGGGGNTFTGNNSTTTTTSSSTSIGSGLKAGGNLKTESGGDTTIRGSTVDVGGDGDMHAGGNVNILDARDKSSTSTSSTSSGLGVGGGVYGSETATDTKTSDKSHGSTLNFGGNAKISSDKTLTIQGSDVTTGGDLGLKGKDVKIIEGRDIETETHSKTTTSFGKIETGESDSSSGSESHAGTDGASAEAGALAEAGASGLGGVTAVEVETNTSSTYDNKSKSSNIKSGGNMTIESDNDTTIRGSNVEAGGDVFLSGKNVNIEAAKDIHTEDTTHSKSQVGLYGSSDNKASADANAGAKADAGGASADAKGSKSGAGANYNAGEASAEAGAHAGAEASSENTLDLMRTTTTTTNTQDVTHTGSTIKSGGNTKIKAEEKLNVIGSDLESGGDMDLKGKDMTFGAAQDSHTTKTETSTTKAGLYADTGADASVDANAEAKTKGLDANAGASAEANANAGVGFYGTNTTESSTKGSTHAKTSTIKSGGNMTRDAENKITDEGTQVEAGGDFTQTSKEWESKAAKDTTFSSSSSETNTGKLGLYGEANAGASASAGVQDGTSNESGAGASAGVQAQYNRETSDVTSSSSTAVTSTIKSGGNMKTTTTGKTSLEGTNLEAGGDMELNAGELDYKAAKNTSSSTSSSSNVDAELKVGIDATKAVTGTISGGYDQSNSTDSSSEAVTGSMKSGGNMKVNTTGDARFEGTNLEAGGDASVKAGGNVKFDAAKNEESHTEDGFNVSGSLSASKSKGSSGKGSTGMGLELEGGMNNSKSSSTEGVAGSIKSGGKLDIDAGKNATFEGTNLESGGDMSIGAKDDVNFNAVKNTASEEGYGFDASLSASKGGKDEAGKPKSSTVGLEASGNYSKSDETTSTGSTLKSRGNLKIKSGGDTNLEGTGIESEGKTSIDAGKSVNFKAAEDTSSSIGIEAGIGGSKTKAAKGGDASENATEGNVSFGVEGGKSSTKKAGSVKAGEIEINAGKDANFEGTGLDSAGDASVKAGGNVNFNAAESSHIDGNLSGGAGSGGNSLTGAGIGGGVEKQGSQINTGGNLKIESGGDTKLEGTKAKVGGSAELQAGGEIEKKSTVSGSGQIGVTRGGASIDVQSTDIDAAGGTTQKSGK
ncbi:MAG TPA: hemagglutinin repeat-containing protein [Patescibacteria group bacterium]|nr:hemagglutinin repeat-containing protein [Patescibacteria group bacterium]